MSENIVVPDVATLAADLKNDPDLIYQYVHDHIRYVPVYGYQRGPVGTTLDGEGSDLDQAVLMQQLLISAGFSGASLVSGQISLTASQLAAWLGTDTTLATSQTLLNNGGVPATVSGSNLVVNHVWVQVAISGTNYVFDPSYKPSTFTSSINIASALGSYGGTAYSASAIGGGGGSVSSATVRSQLAGYATNLQTYIATNYPAAKLEDVIGGSTITPLSMPLTPLRQTSLSYQTGSTSVGSSVPSGMATTVTISMPGVSQTYNSDQLYAQDIYVDYSGSSPALKVGASTYTSSGTGTVSLSLSVTYPSLSSTVTATGSVALIPSGAYELITAYGHVGRGQIERMRKRVTVASGHAGLAVQSLSWLAQSMLASQIKDQLSGTETVVPALVGVYGFLPGSTGQSQPFFDVPILQAVASGLTASAGYAVQASLLDTFGVAHAGTRSTIQQVRLGDAVSVPSLAEGGGGLSQVTALPTGSPYTSGDQTLVSSFVSGGGRAFMAPNTTLSNGWSGYGFALVSQSGAVAYYLSGDRQGGQAATTVTTTSFDSYAKLTAMDPRANGGDGSAAGGSPAHPKPGVDPATGDALWDIGTIDSSGTAFPVGAKIAYNAGALLRPSPWLPPGWSFNYEISATYGDDPFHAMGHEATALDAAATIAGLYISQDLLLSDQTVTSGGTVSATGNYFIAAADTQSWLSDQFKDNTVTITSFNKMMQIGKLPDGTYNAGPGAQLTASSGTLSFTDKFKTVTLFHQLSSGSYGAGNEQVAATITDRVGNATTFRYASSSSAQLSGVESNGLYSVGFRTQSSNEIVVGGNFTLYCANHFVMGGQILGCTSTITKATDSPGGNTPELDFAYTTVNGNSLLSTVTEADHITAAVVDFTNGYDTLGRINQRTSARGYVSHFYLAGNRSEAADPLGNSAVSYTDEYGRPIRSVDPLGNASLATYDGLNRPLSQTASEGNSATYQYDSRGNLTQTTLAPKPGSGLSNIVTSATYNTTWNLPLTKTDALGKVTTMTYDSGTGNLLTVTSPTATIPGGGGTQTPVTSYTSYNSQGQVLSMTGPDGMVTNFAYDPTTYEKLTQDVDDGSSPHLSLTTHWAYDGAGNVASVEDPRGKFSYYSAGPYRLFGSVTTPVATKSVSYNNDIRKSQVNNPNGTYNVLTYDNGDNVVSSVLNGVGGVGTRTTSYTYDNDDRLSTVTDPAGNVTTQNYDAMSRPYQVVNATTNVAVQYAYTANGKKASMTDGGGHVTSFTYDGFDRLITVTYPDSTYGALTYDANGNLLTRRNRNGDTTSFTYDELNRKVGMTPPTGSGDSAQTYIYDIASRQSTISNAGGTFTYAYDTAGRMTSVQRPDGKTISYEYDKNGNRTKLTWPDGYYVTYAYDDGNQMTGIYENGTTVRLATWPNSSFYRPMPPKYWSTRAGNGSLSENLSASYDYFVELTDINASHVGGGTAGFSYTYDSNGRKNSVTQDLTGYFKLWTPPVGSTTTYTSNNLNQYSSIADTVAGTVTPTYDNNGNLTFDGTNTLTWDYQNRLTGATNTTYTTSYTYDLFGRRASKTVNGTTTNYVSDGNQEIAEYDGSGTLLRRYIYGRGIDEILVMINVSSGQYIYHFKDGLGSVAATFDAFSNLVDQRAYGPYGEGAITSGTPFGYTGRRYDAETGMYYYRARYYSPALGRFLSPDPKKMKKEKGEGGDDKKKAKPKSSKSSPSISGRAGESTYAYAGNDPINHVDPTGKDIACYTTFNLVGAAGDGGQSYEDCVVTPDQTGSNCFDFTCGYGGSTDPNGNNPGIGGIAGGGTPPPPETTPTDDATKNAAAIAAGIEAGNNVGTGSGLLADALHAVASGDAAIILKFASGGASAVAALGDALLLMNGSITVEKAIIDVGIVGIGISVGGPVGLGLGIGYAFIDVVSPNLVDNVFGGP